MAEKPLGYVELEWVCPSCNTRNPGPIKTCTGCGAAQPEQVEFIQPAQEKLVEDTAKLAEAAAGPDVHCGFCGTRNSARRKTCTQCGGDLAEGRARASGKVLGAHRDKPAPDVKCPACGAANSANSTKCTQCGEPLQKAAPPESTPAAPKKRGCIALPIILLAIVAIIALVVVQGTRKSELVGQVSAIEWQRSIAVEGLAPVSVTAWRDAIPSGAEIIACRDEVRTTQDEPAPGAIEVCGTPYTVDAGSGYGEVRQDCRYQVLAERCDYRTTKWQVVTTLRSSGQDHNPVWPALSLTAEQREGGKTEQYLVTFDTDGDRKQYRAKSQAEFATFVPGSFWLLEVDGFGSIRSLKPR